MSQDEGGLLLLEYNKVTSDFVFPCNETFILIKQKSPSATIIQSSGHCACHATCTHTHTNHHQHHHHYHQILAETMTFLPVEFRFTTYLARSNMIVKFIFICSQTLGFLKMSVAILLNVFGIKCTMFDAKVAC